MHKILKFFQIFSIIALVLGGTMTSNAQEKCEIYYLPTFVKLDFDSLKHISMHEFINGEFHYLTVARNVQYFAPLPPESLSAPELQADKQILSLADDVQDIYWLYSIASSADVKTFFSGRDSDFAPYILRALKRQNLDDMAQQFAVAMEAFGNRYQGFDASKKSIENFPIPVREAELDEIFLKMMAAYDNSAEGLKYKEAVLKQRELTKKMDGDKISYQRRNMMEYNLFYQQHPQTFAAQKLLDGFPSQNEIYKAIHDKICNNPHLKNWYLTTYNAQTDRAHLWFIQHKLITRKNDLGPRESWPIYYQNIFSLYLFQIEI
ncbi:hypothetical protein [Bartonella sp. HY038]|uniref:hypothetical protein n=1 Tax=Bartonella sp. HY038 TaxID=2759660 RepID=UPI0015F78869|nr:hypothetical protein [Bartonella sp. HY038]